MVSIDLVRKSSGGIEEAVNVERVRAAERNARSDAVKFDLNTDLNGVITWVCLSAAAIIGLTLKSSWSLSNDSCDNGSFGPSPGGVVTGSRNRRGERTLPPLGVMGKSADGITLGDTDSPSDGRLSKDPVRVEKGDANPLSVCNNASSSVSSSGGVSRYSKGLRSNEDILRSSSRSERSSWLRSFSDTLDRGTMESTVIRCRWFLLRFGCGIFVIASSAATAGGTASGEWASRVRRADKDRVRLVAFERWCFCLIGICTALDGVIGRAAEFFMVDEGGLSFCRRLYGRDGTPLSTALVVVLSRVTSR